MKSGYALGVASTFDGCQKIPDGDPAQGVRQEADLDRTRSTQTRLLQVSQRKTKPWSGERLSMYESAYEAFSTYSRIFSKEALIAAELMRITLEKFRNESLVDELRCPSVKELYEIVYDIGHFADRAYKKEKGIDDRAFFMDSYISKEDVFAEMRTLLRDEVQNYYGERNESSK